MRILVTGSRDWEDSVVLASALVRARRHTPPEEMVLVSGACPTGADRMAERIAETSGWTIELHPADWDKHGKRAGFLRNKEMVDLGADAVLAFIRNNSKGATMTLDLARKAGLPTTVWRVDD